MRDRRTTDQLISPCVDLLARLSLDQVPEDWVDTVWEEQFTQAQDLPPDYEELIQGIDVGKVLGDLRAKISQWISRQAREETEEDSQDETVNSVQSEDLYR